MLSVIKQNVTMLNFVMFNIYAHSIRITRILVINVCPHYANYIAFKNAECHNAECRNKKSKLLEYRMSKCLISYCRMSNCRIS